MEVVAIAVGFDNQCIRDIGDRFEVPDNSFEPRQIIVDGKPTGQFHEPPSWFEPVDEALKAKVARTILKLPVPAINPQKQTADFDASMRKKAEQDAAKK